MQQLVELLLQVWRHTGVCGLPLKWLQNLQLCISEKGVRGKHMSRNKRHLAVRLELKWSS